MSRVEKVREIMKGGYGVDIVFDEYFVNNKIVKGCRV
jgi:hypothetical protein